MSLNIDFQGNIFNSSGMQFTGSEVRYRAYYKSNSSSSSSSTWNESRISQFGQYQFNLGDNDFLTQEGNINPGDIVVMLFWTPSTSTRFDTKLIEWGLIELELTSEDIYIQDVMLEDSFSPNFSFKKSGSDRVNEDVVIEDTGCNDEHNWLYKGKIHKQVSFLYGEEMFSGMNQLPTNAIAIEWGDGSSTLDLKAGLSYTHQYTSPGAYTVTVTLTNVSGYTNQYTVEINTYWHEPRVEWIVDNYYPQPEGVSGVGQPVTFNNISNDPDDRMEVDEWTWDWIISDNGLHGDYSESYTEKDYSFAPTHQFHNPSYQEITLICNWHDGVNPQTTKYVWKIKQEPWKITNGLEWDKVVVDSPEVFHPDIGGETSVVDHIDYSVDSLASYNNLSLTTPFTHTFTTPEEHSITQTIYYNDGFSMQNQSKTFSVVVDISVDFTHEIYGCGSKFIADVTPGTNPITKYKWKVKDNETGDIVAEAEGKNLTEFKYSWAYPGTFNIVLSVTDSESNSFSIIKQFYGDCNTNRDILVGGPLEFEVNEDLVEGIVDDDYVSIDIKEYRRVIDG